MRILTIAAQKGGSGKTTLALSLAVAAHLDGRRVRVFDLDPQATAAAWGDRRGVDAPLVESLQPARLQQALANTQAAADLVVIDTPPRLDHGTLGAVRAADVLLIPCRPSVFDLETLGNTLDLVRFSGTTAAVLAVMNAVPARAQLFNRTLLAKARAVIESAGLEVCPVTVGQRSVFDKASLRGRGVQELEADGKAADEVAELYSHCSPLLWS